MNNTHREKTEKLKNYMQLANVSKKDLAENLGYASSYISNVLSPNFARQTPRWIDALIMMFELMFERKNHKTKDFLGVQVPEDQIAAIVIQESTLKEIVRKKWREENRRRVDAKIESERVKKK